jgi:hypothetical protein
MRIGTHLQTSLGCVHDIGNIFVVTRGVHVEQLLSRRVLIGVGVDRTCTIVPKVRHPV